MPEWAEEDKRRFSASLRWAKEAAAEATAHRASSAEEGKHDGENDPDPGNTYRIVETPAGEAKLIAAEEDGEVLIWLLADKLTIRVAADLVRWRP
ncbi:MAG: hypothetical protein ACLQUT_10680 [Thermoleophilia bacterium]